MTSSEPLSDKSVASVANAIFAKGGPTVVEAWSEFGSEPRHFVSAAEICAYATEKRGGKPGSVHLAVHYPDTAGRLVQKRVSLNPGACDGFSHRFTFEGWGLIWAYLHLAGANAADSFVSANTQKRAEKWAAKYPEQDPPSAWYWPAVSSHCRRLRNALKSSSNQSIKPTVGVDAIS